MAIMANQHRGQQGALFAAQQYGRVCFAARHRDIGGRVIPGARQAATLPQRNDLRDIVVFDARDAQLVSVRRGAHSTLPGFMMPSGSSIALISRINCIATLSFTRGSSSRLSTPMPCSAEIEPPIRRTISNTTALTSCQRARNSAGSLPTGWLTL